MPESNTPEKAQEIITKCLGGNPETEKDTQISTPEITELHKYGSENEKLEKEIYATS